jgi:DNA-binding transcriptional MocR family regulator
LPAIQPLGRCRQLRDNLRDAILSGEITGRLPSAKALGQMNDGMAVNTVSKALNALQAEGLIRSRKGWGLERGSGGGAGNSILAGTFCNISVTIRHCHGKPVHPSSVWCVTELGRTQLRDFRVFGTGEDQR